MVRQEHVLTVFVASPGDVETERNKLEDVIRELNMTWSRDLKVRLDLVRWETHAFPDTGIDAQDVINQQIPDDYDIFIGIMWSRYGTKTGRAGSGTVEEFDRARARFDESQEAVRLMIYFKDEPLPPSKIEPEQLALVNRFRQELGSEGTLYWKFSSISEFETLIRLHLARHIQAWKKRTESPANTNTAATLECSEALHEEDEGILDLLEVFEDRFAELIEISGRIASATEEIGSKMQDRTTEIDTLPRDQNNKANPRDAKRLMTRVASDLTQYSARIEAEVPLFREALTAGVNSLVRASAMYTDLSVTGSELENVEESLRGMSIVSNALKTSKASIQRFRDSMAALPKMTTDLNRAKREAIGILDSLISEFTSGETLLAESEKVFQDLLKS